MIYNHKKVQVFSEKIYGKLRKDIRLKAKSFPIVSGKTMGKLFRGFGTFFDCFLDTPKCQVWCKMLYQKAAIDCSFDPIFLSEQLKLKQQMYIKQAVGVGLNKEME
ncbi:MAG: hypothetical protein PHX49_04300 [Bacteroidales bacterium]|nr:hypothetical protein [Bacteroidales bacterium]